MNHSTPDLPVHHHLPEFTETHVHRVGDVIQPSHPLSSPFPPAPNPSQHQSFSNESTLHMRWWPKYWSFSFSIIPSKEIPGLISFRMDWLDLLAVQGLSRVFSCRERAPPVAKVMRKEAWNTQRRDQASGVSLEILEHLPPKPESAYFMLCAFTYTSDFTGGCPPLPLSEKRVSLQLQLIIPGCDSVSTYKLLWKSSSLPE